MKKAKNGTLQPMGKNFRKVGENKYISEDGNYKFKFKGGSDTSAPTSAVQRRTLKGFLKGAPKAGFKTKMAKMGTSVKKMQYGGKAASMVPTKARKGATVKKALLGSVLGGVAGKAMLGGMGKKMLGGLAGKALGGLMGKNGKNVNKAKSGGSMKKCKYGCK
jgi:outer membrane lipoprotein SlyB